MDGDSKSIDTACRLLELYKVAKNTDTKEISSFKIYKSKIYGMTKVYSFDFKNKHYYISDDYSLMDNPDFIRNVLEQINPSLKGNPLKNPVPQSDGANYASGLDGTEYYLWEAPKE